MPPARGLGLRALVKPVMILLGVWLVFHYGITLIIPHVVDQKAIKQQIIDGVRDGTNMTMSIGRFKIQPTLLSGVQVKLGDVELSPLADRKTAIKAGEVWIDVRYWPLIRHQEVAISTFHLKRINLPRGSEVVLKSIESASENTRNPDAEKMFHGSTLVGEYIYIDEPGTDKRSGLNWRISDLKIGPLMSDNPLNVKAEGWLAARKVNTTFRTEATLKQPEMFDDPMGALLGASMTTTGNNIFADVKYSHGNADRLQVIAKPVDLARVSDVLHDVVETYNLPPRFAYNMTGLIKGDGVIDLRNGQILKGAGDFELQNVALAPADNPNDRLIEKLNGKLFLEGEKVRLQKWRLFVDGNPFDINGTLALTGDIRHAKTDLSLKGKNLNLDTLSRTAAEFTGVHYQIAGRADLDVHLKGPVDRLIYDGTLDLHNVRYKDPKSGILISRVNGRVDLGETFALHGVTAYVGENQFRANGSVYPSGRYDIFLTGERVNLASIRHDLTAMSPTLGAQLKDLQELTGNANLNLHIVSPKGRDPLPDISGNILVTNAHLRHSAFGEGIDIARMNIRIEGNHAYIDETVAMIGGPNGVPLTISGDISQLGAYNFKAHTGQMPVAQLRDNRAFYENLLKVKLPEIWNAEGTFSLNAEATTTGQKAVITLADAGLSWKGGDFPVYDVNGTLNATITPERLMLQTDGLTARYGNSPVRLTIDYSKHQHMIVHAKGQFSPLVVNHYLTSRLSTQSPYRHLPFDVHLAGEALPPKDGRRRGKLTASARLDLGDTTPDNPDDESDAYALLNLQAGDGMANFDNSKIKLKDAGEIDLSGQAQKLFTPAERTLDLRLQTPEPIDFAKIAASMDTEGLLDGSTGTVALDVNYKETPIEGGVIDGAMTVDELHVPELDLLNITGKVKMDNDGAKYDFPALYLPGVTVGVKAETVGPPTYPAVLEDVKIKGDLLHVPSLQAFFKEKVEGVIQPRIVQRLFRPWQEGDPLIPISFRDGSVDIKEVIYDNIILEDVTGKLSVYANSFFELRDVALKAAGGDVTGYLSMNPADNNFTSLQLDTHDVKVNAVTQALLGVSNQIFGDLDGSIRFTTQGMTDDDMLKNANGIVRLTIADGRLPAIAKIETLLTGANLIRGGVLGLNFNNLFRTIAPFRTNYFAELSGDLLVVNKYIHTENLLSDGENLDLLIQGDIAMDDGSADLWVNGKMSQDVSGRLGKLGTFSVNTLLRKIPFLGFLPGHEKKSGVLYWIPGVGYTPWLGGAGDEFNHFRVHLQGMLDDPSAVRSFDWVKTPEY